MWFSEILVKSCKHPVEPNLSLVVQFSPPFVGIAEQGRTGHGGSGGSSKVCWGLPNPTILRPADG
jgi:hypothetical protein